MTIAEAAERLGLDPSTLRRQAEKGVLRASRLGPIWVVTPREVERYRREHLGRIGGRKG